MFNIFKLFKKKCKHKNTKDIFVPVRIAGKDGYFKQVICEDCNKTIKEVIET